NYHPVFPLMLISGKSQVVESTVVVSACSPKLGSRYLDQDRRLVFRQKGPVISVTGRRLVPVSGAPDGLRQGRRDIRAGIISRGTLDIGRIVDLPLDGRKPRNPPIVIDVGDDIIQLVVDAASAGPGWIGKDHEAR